jgi:hypothetical protein
LISHNFLRGWTLIRQILLRARAPDLGGSRDTSAQTAVRETPFFTARSKITQPHQPADEDLLA